VRLAKAALHRRGWAVLRDLPFLAAGRADERAVLAIASAFGIPSGRDGGCHVWPVRPDPRGEGDTFSTRSGAAGFHTDAQYHRVPESFVCLFTVRPARTGGLTRVLSVGDATGTLRARADGERLLRSLAEPVWRWRMPHSLGGCGDAGGDPGGAPVLPGDGTMRWRGDNLAAGTPSAQRSVVPAVEQCLDTAQGAQTLALRPGDVVIVDNKRALHGRTAFDDPQRLLLRVRLWAS
jgi:alpha-ketoglutarate-dependent taurine dioxygenase